MTLQLPTRRVLGGASIFALSFVAFGSTAHADGGFLGTAGTDGDARLVYSAVAGVENEVVASVRWNNAKTRLIYVIDDVIRIKAGGPCSHPDKDDTSKVRCVVTPPEGAEPYPTLTMNLGDADDHVWFRNRTGQSYFFNKFALGPGSDKFEGTTDGVDGSLVLGQGGDDDVKAGARAAVSGGNGKDMVTVFGKNSAASGGKGDDQLWGSNRRQFLVGGTGDDQIWGGSGNDEIWGDDGNDKLWGQVGDDTIHGGKGNDWIRGGKGKDVLRGGPGKNVVKQ